MILAVALVVCSSNQQNLLKNTVVDNLSEELGAIFKDLKEEKNSFEKIGISFDEKAFYDILVEVAEKYNFKDRIEDVKFIYLAKE